MAKFWAKRINYDIDRIGEVPKAWREAVREALGPDLSSMTKSELLAYAQEHGVEAYESWTKAEIIAAIEGA